MDIKAQAPHDPTTSRRSIHDEKCEDQSTGRDQEKPERMLGNGEVLAHRPNTRARQEEIDSQLRHEHIAALAEQHEYYKDIWMLRDYNSCYTRRYPPRLLNTETYEMMDMKLIIQKYGSAPSYAILSHTWLPSANGDHSEATYQDMHYFFLQMKHNNRKPHGWLKLTQFCKVAMLDGFKWAWMDTCCIDKTNLADTQEAINAMFRWYENATICYAYLSDIDSKTNKEGDDVDIKAANWFKRSWTLQELLAPSFVQFLNKDWEKIGTQRTLSNQIEQVARINAEDMRNFRACSIAKKLSWAADRHATFIEDEAYSLIGLFGISMPLIYGEGQRAFIRFQEELTKTYDDESIFAWSAGSNIRPESPFYCSGFLAPSVRCFKDACNIQKLETPLSRFFLSNRGLEFETRTCWKRRPDKNQKNKSEVLIELSCQDVSSGQTLAMLVHRRGQNLSAPFSRSLGASLAVKAADDVKSAEATSQQWSSYRSSDRDLQKVVSEGLWEKMESASTVLKPAHAFEMPRVLIVILDYKQHFESDGIHGDERDKQVSPFDGRGPRWEGLESLNRSSSDACFLLHGHVEWKIVKLKRVGSKATHNLTVRSSAPDFSTHDSPDFGFISDMAIRGGVNHVEWDLREMPKPPISLSLFPIPMPGPTEVGGSDENKILSDAVKESKGLDLRVYKLKVEARQDNHAKEGRMKSEPKTETKLERKVKGISVDDSSAVKKATKR